MCFAGWSGFGSSCTEPDPDLENKTNKNWTCRVNQLTWLCRSSCTEQSCCTRVAVLVWSCWSGLTSQVTLVQMCSSGCTSLVPLQLTSAARRATRQVQNHRSNSRVQLVLFCWSGSTGRVPLAQLSCSGSAGSDPVLFVWVWLCGFKSSSAGLGPETRLLPHEQSSHPVPLAAVSDTISSFRRFCFRIHIRMPAVSKW